MQVLYKGYEIKAEREGCQAGYDLLYFSIFRASDGLEVVSDFTSGSESEAEFIGYLKRRVDEFERTKGESEDMADEFSSAVGEWGEDDG